MPFLSPLVSSLTHDIDAALAAGSGGVSGERPGDSGRDGSPMPPPALTARLQGSPWTTGPLLPRHSTPIRRIESNGSGGGGGGGGTSVTGPGGTPGSTVRRLPHQLPPGSPSAEPSGSADSSGRASIPVLPESSGAAAEAAATFLATATRADATDVVIPTWRNQAAPATSELLGALASLTYASEPEPERLPLHSAAAT